MVDGYDVTARGYLVRCGERLREAEPASLFYAAQELRCCVEAKLTEFIEHYRPYRKRRVQPFKIGENAKLTQKIIAREVIAQVTICVKGQRPLTLYYTPVSPELEKYCKSTVDQLRHAQLECRQPDDPWWENTRNDLLRFYRLAWIACRGELVLPPLWNKTTNQTHPLDVRFTEENAAQLRSWQRIVGQSFEMGVMYLDAPPAAWVCDL